MSENQIQQLQSLALKKAILQLDHQSYSTPANDFGMPTVYRIGADGINLQGFPSIPEHSVLDDSPIERIIHLIRDYLYQGKYSLQQLMECDSALTPIADETNTRISICLTYVAVRENNGLKYSFLVNNSDSCRRPGWVKSVTIRDYAPEGSSPEKVKAIRAALKAQKLWHHGQFYAMNQPMSEREINYVLTYFSLCCARYVQKFLDAVYLEAKKYGEKPNYFRHRSDTEICRLLASAT